MAATLKTYDVVCPDPDCAAEFKVERDPSELARGDGDLIECPECQEEWEFDYIPGAPEHPEDELILSDGDEDDDDDEAEGMDLTAFDDEEDEEDDYE